MPCTGQYGESSYEGGGVTATAVTAADSSSATLCSSRCTELRRTGCNGQVPACTNGAIIAESTTTFNGAALSSLTSSQAEQQQSSANCRLRTPSSRSAVINPNISFAALHPLPGEELENENWVDLCYCRRLFLTQYRIIIVTHNHGAACSIPLTNVESVEAKDIVGLHIICKDGRIIRVQAGSSEVAIAWYKKLTQITCGPRALDDLFAFKFYAQLLKKDKCIPWLARREESSSCGPGRKSYEVLCKEFKHLGLRESAWRITSANENFEKTTISFRLCSTYPEHLIVPAAVTNEELSNMRKGRYYDRFPTLAWRCKKNGSSFAQECSADDCDHDVKLYDKIRAATMANFPANSTANPEAPTSSKFLIIDARSYTAAWANRAKGGGFEASDTYTDAEVAFMGLPNIHNIRYSFHQLRQLLNLGSDQNTFLQALQSTNWLQNIGFLFNATERCLRAMCSEGTSVLVHCSDGWDRTTQIVSLCMLIGDPFYRTFEGFELLVQRQWIGQVYLILEFGHKFGDRSGTINGDENERSPVFLQFLDCVYQLWMKNPDAFEFNRRYLDAKKACAERLDKLIAESGARAINSEGRLPSIWDYLGKHNSIFFNPAYDAHRKPSTLSFPKQISEVELWRDAYCCTKDQSRINNPEEGGQAVPAITTTGIHDVSTMEKMTTLSRSQSASSLTSLEQNSSSTVLNGGMHASSTSSNHSSYGVVQQQQQRYNNESANNNHSTTPNSSSLQNLNSLDVDGLSKVPIVFEDRVVELFRQMELQVRNTNLAAAERDAYYHHHHVVNQHVLNGKLASATIENGIINGAHTHPSSNISIPSTNSIPTSTSRRVRNESIDSTSFGFEVIDEFDPCCITKRKHDSASSAGNSSSCSTFTNFSGECPITSNCNGCKNQIRSRIPSHTHSSHSLPTNQLNSENNGHQHHSMDEEGEEVVEEEEENEAVLVGEVREISTSSCCGNGQLVAG